MPLVFKNTRGIFFVLFFEFVFSQQIKIGAEVFLEKKNDLIKNKKIALVCNSASFVSSYKKNIYQIFLEKKTDIEFILTPEHGFNLQFVAGEKFENQIDSTTKIPIISLYGNNFSSLKKNIEKIDVVIFDLQDVGSRYFTFISTMKNVMEICCELNKTFIVLDRPNPLGLEIVEGFMLEDSLKSFIGTFEIPIRHGLTVGEIANMVVEKKIISNSQKLNLIVIQCENLKRNFIWNELNLIWKPPSPNMISDTTAFVYNGTCLFEGTNISEGRGTKFPFQIIGAKWIDGKKLLNELSKYNLGGVKFSEIKFLPISNEKSKHPKYENENCEGIFLEITNFKKFESIKTTIAILCAIQNFFPNDLKFDENFFDKLAGTKKMREAILSNENFEKICLIWQNDCQKFLSQRKRFLIYE